MLKEIKLPFNTSLLEVLTISFFMAVGYSVLYKYFFYNNLGVEWYIYSLTPSFIIFSSFNLLFNLLLGFFVGSVLCGYKYRDFISFITSILVFIFCIFIFFFRYYVSEIIDYDLKSLIIIIWGVMLSVIIFIYFRLYLIVGGFSNFLTRLCLIVVCAMWILMAVTMASSESFKLINNIYSNGVVVLKGSKNDWGIVEMNGDKILLIGKEKKGLKYKLVEYKEVSEIKAVK